MIILKKIKRLFSKDKQVVDREILAEQKRNAKLKHNRPNNEQFRHAFYIKAGVGHRDCDKGTVHPLEVCIDTNRLIYRVKQIGTGFKDIFVGTAGLVTNFAKVTVVNESTVEDIIDIENTIVSANGAELV